jgi:hypothetical protein
MASGDDDSRFSPLDRAVFAGLRDGDGVIVDTQTAFYFGLNKTAAFLWAELQKLREVTVGQLADVLCGKFEVARADAERDVQEFLVHVVKFGLARRVSGAEQPAR